MNKWTEDSVTIFNYQRLQKICQIIKILIKLITIFIKKNIIEGQKN
jgi:hypothetical protein